MLLGNWVTIMITKANHKTEEHCKIYVILHKNMCIYGDFFLKQYFTILKAS